MDEGEDVSAEGVDSCRTSESAWDRVGGSNGIAVLLVPLNTETLSMDARVTPAVSLKHFEHIYPVWAEP